VEWIGTDDEVAVFHENPRDWLSGRQPHDKLKRRSIPARKILGYPVRPAGHSSPQFGEATDCTNNETVEKYGRIVELGIAFNREYFTRSLLNKRDLPSPARALNRPTSRPDTLSLRSSTRMAQVQFDRAVITGFSSDKYVGLGGPTSSGLKDGSDAIVRRDL